jgi:primosomal protein N' (replication factor Y) (superfamily II helicase)
VEQAERAQPADSPEQGLELASVAVGRPVRGAFTYLVPPALQGRLARGQRLLVPFGRGRALGFYLGPGLAPPGGGLLKPVHSALEETPAIPEDILALVEFAASHYRHPLGEAMRVALPPGLTDVDETAEPRAEVVRTVVVGSGADPDLLRRAPAQAATLQYLLAVGGRAELEELGRAVPGARGAVDRLVARGWVHLEEQPLEPTIPEGLGQARPGRLTEGQGTAVAAITGALDTGGFQPFLLQGVTGSGKTEVYLRAAEHVLSGGDGALVLVPEIALTPQLVGRFRSRFGNAVAVLHSGLRDRERLVHWTALRSGSVRIAVGVRSAVFAPVRNLRLLVVDEEHDPSFKQDEKLRYQARDLAVVRARQAQATIVLGSATPSLESLENARRGRYRHLRLPVRVDDRPLPAVELVDLRRSRPRHQMPATRPPALSPPVVEALGETLARGKQAILFLNRRGHSSALICEACGQGVPCSQCDVSLTFHLGTRALQCHYCGETRRLPEACGSCGGALFPVGSGTERVELEVAERFPRARVARLDRDAAGNTERLTQLLASFARGEIDVLVGTQMVAKGHDFPGVTLVCVVSADTGLLLPDFRAGERTFQLVTQVGGRAGRGDEPGRVLVQTWNPEVEAVARVATHDYDGFVRRELAWRQALAWPPFSRLVAVRVEGEDAKATAEVARRLGARLTDLLPSPVSGVRLLGPAPAALPRLRGRSRWQLLLKAPRHALLNPLLDQLERDLEQLPASVRVVIDVDPGAML